MPTEAGSQQVRMECDMEFTTIRLDICESSGYASVILRRERQLNAMNTKMLDEVRRS